MDETLMARAARASALSRRTVLASLGALAAPALATRAFAQAPGRGGPPPTAEEIAAALPLKTTGLEHFGMVVPDVSAQARFYSRIFSPDGLRKEKQGNLRYYVDLNGGYIAIGGRAAPVPPYIDHFCALVEDYNAAAMSARLEAEGLPPGRFGIFPDPSGLGLQLLGVPGGFAASTEPTTRIVNGDALVTPMGLAHMLLQVNDVDESLGFYTRFFTGAVERQSDPDQAWIQIEDTLLGLQPRSPTAPPRIDEFGVKVAPFDRDAVATELRILGATVTSQDDSGMLRFRDPYGLGVALLPV